MSSTGDADSSQIDINGVLYNVSQIFYNGTMFNTTSCTAETCSLLLGTHRYLPNIPGNAFFAVVFGLLFVVNVPIGVYYRTWGVMVSMAFGLGLEVAGYAARILIHNDDFSRIDFIIYIYCITLGPAFLSAAIYLCLERIVVVYGEDYSRLKPRTYSIAFIAGDFIALAVQGTGGGLAVVEEFQYAGVDVIIGGLGFQVLSLTIFAIVCADFAWRVRRRKGTLNPSFEALRRSRVWAGFLWSIAIATSAIYARSVYRVAELQAGFHSDLANQQALFMVLEGTVIAIASFALTVFHPGLVFGRMWKAANFQMKGKRGAKQEPSSLNLNVERATDV